MTKVEEIKSAIQQLSLEERAELAKWLYGWEDDEWDRQIAADYDAGRLDKLIEQARQRMAAGELRDMP
jgi:hypothetical protein